MRLKIVLAGLLVVPAGLAGVPLASADAPPAATSAATATSAANPADTPQLHKQGRWLVDHYGRVVIVHGMNLVWKRAPYVPSDSPEGFTEADAEWLADHGFNGARLGTLWAGVSATGPNAVDTTYLDKWQRVIDDLADRGIWMQFDFHQDQWNEVYGGEGVPSWAVKRPLPWSLLPPVNPPFPTGYWTPEQSTVWDNFWADRSSLLTAWVGAWRSVAAHWKDQPYSMGYDLLNEPWAGLEWEVCLLNGCPGHYTRELQPAMTRALRAIREVDAESIVWFEPQQLAGGRGTPTNFIAVPGENQLGFSWHNYCPQVFFASLGIPLQNAENCAPYTERMQVQALDQGERMNAVGLMSEFGASDNERAIELDMDATDRHFTSWMHWAYKHWSDPTTADTAQGLFTNDADLTSTKPKLKLLVRTYPQATCGTPLALDFDAQTGDFDYSYVAGTCNGRPTEIFVSPLHYPNGYDLDVDGGTVTGTASHHRVLVQAAPGSEVTVSVRRKP